MSGKTVLMSPRRKPGGICIVLVLALAAVLAYGATAQAPPAAEAVEVNLAGATHSFPHFWERTFGSGRAILSLRESFRRDLRAVKKATGFEYIRFHAIFHDEVGAYDEDPQGRPVYNWSYVDQIYDGLLENGVRPFVELSFMPRKLASTEVTQAFWYHPYNSPPKNWEKWGALITAFAQHLVDRYGISEVSQWYFEVWNEPNIDFWSGEPKQPTYYQLYDVTARALKQVNPKLRVGGPATAQAAWIDSFIRHCAQVNVPVDFVSSHVYANDTAQDVFGTNESIPRDQMVYRAVKKVHDQVKASAKPELPVIFSEYNTSYKNEVEVTDSEFMGPWIASTIRQTDGLVDTMAYWCFSDVFEEQGVVRTPFYGGFGLIAEGNIPKAAFNAFTLLHRLGTERLAVNSDSVLATKRPDGSFAIAVWNYAPPGERGLTKRVDLQITGAPAGARFTTQIVDHDHASALTAWQGMGSPAFPTPKQLRDLRAAADIAPPAAIPAISAGGMLNVSLTLPPYRLELIEIIK
jgi:xylan 1,4-beta-xylosidase